MIDTGQYYKSISLDKQEYVSPWDYNNGAKIMEHSYLGNEFMNAIESLLAPTGAWYKTRIVWAGDYADHEPDTENNLWDITTNKIKPRKHRKKYRYIINHTTKQYVDKNKLKPDRFNFTIHPLSLLTAEGNGGGGGDYHGNNEYYVGIWARNVISVDNAVPEGYEELEIQFIEEY